jgi:CheY-like chemotaxis protein
MVVSLPVLVVEDHPSSEKLLRIILEGRGFRVDTCRDPDCAVQRTQATSYAVLLLDINLGHPTNGFHLLRKIRQFKPNRSTPAIAVTAYALPGDRERCLHNGFDAYVSKPFTHATLFHAIQDVLKTEGGG